MKSIIIAIHGCEEEINNIITEIQTKFKSAIFYNNITTKLLIDNKYNTFILCPNTEKKREKKVKIPSKYASNRYPDILIELENKGCNNNLKNNLIDLNYSNTNINNIVKIIKILQSINNLESLLQKYITNKVDKYKTKNPAIIFSFDKGQDLLLSLAQCIYNLYLVYPMYRCIYSYKVNNTNDGMFKTAIMFALYSANSKYSLYKIKKNIRIGVVIPVFNESNRMQIYSNYNPLGENAFFVKHKQLNWLIYGLSKISLKIVYIGDNDDSNSINEVSDLAKSLNDYEYDIEVTTLRKLANTYKCIEQELIEKSIKGGSILLGLYHLWKCGYNYGVYSDFDITCSLSHIGLLVKNVMNPKVAITSFSRRLRESYGYFWNGKQNMISTLYQKLNSELLAQDITDINVGYKCIDLSILGPHICGTVCTGLSFDSELIIICKKLNFTFQEVAGCFIHEYVEGKQGVYRDYNKMLNDTYDSLIRNNVSLMSDSLFLYCIMQSVGGFYNFVNLLKLIKLKDESNTNIIERFCDNFKY